MATITRCSIARDAGRFLTSRVRRLGRCTAPGIALGWTVGCQTWRQVPDPAPAPGTARRLPGRVRVTRADLSVQEVRHAHLTSDSLAGYALPTGTRDSVRVAFPVNEVRRIEARGRTAGLRSASLSGS
jgi:hypothetical protein